MSKEQTAHIRRIDQLGRVSVPKDIRDALDLRPEDALRITLSGKSVVMEKAQNACVFCGSLDDLTPFGDRFVCKECLNKLTSL